MYFERSCNYVLDEGTPLNDFRGKKQKQIFPTTLKVSSLPGHQYFRSLKEGQDPTSLDFRKNSKRKVSVITMYFKPWMCFSSVSDFVKGIAEDIRRKEDFE